MAELTDNGLKISTFTENREKLENNLKAIYGDDINLEQNSPDGQLVGVLAQAQTDFEELLMGVWNGLNPEKATGVALDRDYSMNGISRKAGTYTYVNIVFTFSAPCTLPGLEEDGEENAYTVRDSAGNLYFLENRYTAGGAGTSTLQVRAQNIGKVEVLPNTINIPVTVVLGVVSVNNPFGAVVVGIDEETDYDFRQRRNRAIYSVSTGFDDSMKGGLLTVQDVNFAEIYDNRYGDYSSYGVPLHGLWVVVDGGGNQEVAEMIFSKLAAGIPLYGSVEEYVIDAYGKSNKIKFDRVSQEGLYVKGNLKSVSGKDFDVARVVDYIVANASFGVNEVVSSNDIINLITAYNSVNGTDIIGVDILVSNDNAQWVQFIAPTRIINRFEVSADTISFTKQQ